MIIFCDGASNPHKKRSGIGAVWYNNEDLEDPEDPKTVLSEPYKTLSEEIFSVQEGRHPTNNEAEYLSLIRALEETEETNSPVIIYMDSKLIINQVNNRWKINFPHLAKLKAKVDKLREDIQVDLRYVPREYNSMADKASKDCLK